MDKCACKFLVTDLDVIDVYACITVVYLAGGVNECKYLEVLWRLLWSSYLCKNFKQTLIRLD